MDSDFFHALQGIECITDTPLCSERDFCYPQFKYLCTFQTLKDFTHADTQIKSHMNLIVRWSPYLLSV